MTELELKILEAYTRDVGRGVARIDYDTMDELDLSTGEYIEIDGISKVVAKALPLYPSDEGKKIIRIDKSLRQNLKSDITSSIKIKKIKPILAEFVIVSPLTAIPIIDERYLADALENVAIIEEMCVIIPYFGGRLDFVINQIKPSGSPAIITQKTEFKIADTATQELIAFDNIIKGKKKEILESFSITIKDLKMENIIEEFKQVQGKIKTLDDLRKEMADMLSFAKDNKSIGDSLEKALDEWIQRQKQK